MDVRVCSLIEDPNEFSKTRERERESGFSNLVFTESSNEDDRNQKRE